MNEDKKLLHWILKVTVGTLASITVAVVIVLLSGIFIDSVDNKDIFAVSLTFLLCPDIFG